MSLIVDLTEPSAIKAEGSPYTSNLHLPKNRPSIQANFQTSQSSRSIQHRPRNTPNPQMQSSILPVLHAIWMKVYSPGGMPFANSLSALTALRVSRYHINYISQTITTHIKPPTRASNVNDTDFAQIENSLPKAKNTSVWQKDRIMEALTMFHEKRLNSRDLALELIESGVTDEFLFVDGKMLLYLGAMGEMHVADSWDC
ncbi:hypothetical protein BDZ45DRAFT_394971 [Acephala macrosclerotiorum]|nr:hypothetical protein BDZ45DRAFT_394971 [Acephala macrosclerotiorum]